MTLLELKPSKEEVLKMIEKKFDNHCPYSDKIDRAEERLDAFDKYKTEHQEWGQRENMKNQMLLQELVINTKNICDHLQIKYFKKNGD